MIRMLLIFIPQSRKIALSLQILLAIVGLIIVGSVTAKEVDRFNTLYEELVREYWQPPVIIHGIETTVFDYESMQRSAGPLMEEIVTILDEIVPAKIDDENDAKAFWINVYNFSTMRMVVDVYPVDSINSFKISLIQHPWSKKSIRVGGRWYTLSQIEKDILLQRFNDSRIIFAVNCAAVSCPDRSPEIFEGNLVDSQIDEIIRSYFRNPEKGLWLDRKTSTLTVAWIFKQDRRLFPDGDKGIIKFISPYLDERQQAWLVNNEVTLAYFEHDWTLNDLAQAEKK